MNGNYNQYNPSEMFRLWIQKNGQAQAEFIQNFGTLMANQSNQSFNPLETLRDVTEKTRDAQSKILDDVKYLQSKGMDAMFGIGQMLPAFLNWGAYKTTLSSNGRISIPEAERSALGLGEGDLVQVIVIPITKRTKEVKK